MKKPVPMEYHKPGVSIYSAEDDFCFQVWGPSETRPHYAAFYTQGTGGSQMTHETPPQRRNACVALFGDG